jgi:hypothetical protein
MIDSENIILKDCNKLIFTSKYANISYRELCDFLKQVWFVIL